MNTTMFNVYSALKNNPTGERTFIMTAPLSSLGMLLNVHRDALVRIVSEIEMLRALNSKPEASLHMNGKGPFGHLVFFVTKA